MKINYPVKYTAMPIIEQVGWVSGMHDLERKYDIVCYIVSKCYLVNETINYKENGQVVKKYEVVFPYQKGAFNNWVREVPEFNYLNDRCINSTNISAVFESYEEALHYAKVENDKLCENAWTSLSYSDNFIKHIQEKKNNFDLKLSKYKLLEQQILKNTEDMKIGQNKIINNVIGINNDNIKLYSVNIYEILKVFDNDDFMIYNISQNQYDKLTNLINEGKIIDISQIEYQDQIYHDQKGKLLNQAENKNNRLSFYTTETRQDIMDSKITTLEIDLDKENLGISRKR